MVRVFKEQREVAQSVKFNARELAKLNQISLRQLQRDFRHQLGRSPQDWLNEQRILAAQHGLRQGDPIKKVAMDLGYKQTSHFCRKFKNFTGVTPSVFKSTLGAAECR